MRLWSFALTGIGLLTLAAGFVSSRASALAGTGIVVDDDRAQCPQAGFTTIQSAIDSLGANPTGTITVCAGSYRESLTISSATHLTLAGRAGAVIVPEFIPNNSTVAEVLFSSDVTIRGFTFDGLGDDGTDGDAIALEFFHSSGTIQNNTFDHWHTFDFETTADGLNVIHLVGGGGQAVKVTHNTISDFQTNAILAEGLSTLTISRNDINTKSNTVNTATGISVRADRSGAPSGSIKSNKLTSDSFSGGFDSLGIRAEETGNLFISRNTLTDWALGMYLPSFCTITPLADGNEIRSNTIKQVSIGIMVEAFGVNCAAFADNDRIIGNKITSSVPAAIGIFVRARGLNAHGSAQNEVVTGNTITDIGDPLEHPAEFNGVISGVFEPNRIVS